jgi:biopolymer transport protein ExbD
MAKVKVPRKSTTVDMTAMTDVAFLLLTFFMLATRFKPDEPVQVDTPSSVSEIQLPDIDVMLLTIDKEGRVFFGVDDQETRVQMLDKMSQKYGVSFTEEEKAEFKVLTSFGVPINELKAYLKVKPEDRNTKFVSKGIPCDSTNNELSEWVWNARLANNDIRVAIKGDQDANFPVIKQVIATIQDRNVNRFNFITTLEGGGK